MPSVPSRIDFARTTDDVRQVAAFDTSHYVPEDTIGYDELLSWWLAFPRGLIVARAESGRIVGSLGLWPVTPGWLDAVPAGANPEKFLSADTIRAAVGSQCIEHCYIGGIGVDNPRSFLGSCDMVLMLQKGIMQLGGMENFARDAWFYAIPAEHNEPSGHLPGLDLIIRLRFELVPGKRFKPDLYRGRREGEFLDRVGELSEWILSRLGPAS